MQPATLTAGCAIFHGNLFASSAGARHSPCARLCLCPSVSLIPPPSPSPAPYPLPPAPPISFPLLFCICLTLAKPRFPAPFLLPILVPYPSHTRQASLSGTLPPSHSCSVSVSHSPSLAFRHPSSFPLVFRIRLTLAKPRFPAPILLHTLVLYPSHTHQASLSGTLPPMDGGRMS